MNFHFTFYLWITLFVCSVLSRESPKLNKLSIPEQLSIESRATLLCAVSSGDQPIDFQWTKDGVPFTSGSIEQLNEWTSSLTIYPLSLSHIGNYSCIASNEAGTSRVTAPLFVTAPPHWIVEPFDVKVRRREKAIFHCEARGSPEAKITWKRVTVSDEVLPLPTDSRVYENGSLIIFKSEKSTSGFYTCEATNGIGDGLMKRVTLTVYEYPAVERIVDHITVERGHAAVVSCLATGDPPLYFAWMKNRKYLDEMPGILKRSNFTEIPSSEHVEFALSITRTEPEDEGLYTCIAKNDYGSEKKDIRLMLVERPQSPSHVEVVDVWSRSTRVRWNIPSNGNSPIVSYTVEYWSNPGGHWTETVSSSLTSCVLRGLKPFTQYSFHVWASNDIGDSEPSEQSQFSTAKEEPTAAPLDFKIEDVGSTFVRISWKPPPPEDWNGIMKGYYVGYKQSSSKLPFTYNTVEAGDEHIYYVLRGLRRGTRYLVTVRSFNDVGSGPSTEELPLKTLNQEPPPQPILVVKDIGSTYLQIQWILSEASKLNIAGYTVHFRKNGEKWSEISIPDATQTAYTLTNLDSGVPYQVYITSVASSGFSEPSEIATVRTSAEAIYHNTPKSANPPAAVDDVTQILYIVVPVAVATVIIVIVIVTACVYVYSKRPLPPCHPYGDLPVSKNFSYMSTMPRQRDIPITVCGGNAMKYGSPYSTVPLTRPEQEDDEPIYESVMEEIRSKINQRPYEDDIKMGTATIV